MMWLKLIRWPNLVLIALMQAVVHYGFLVQQEIPLGLDHLHFGLLVLATVILAAGGYLLNNFYDVDSDQINGKYNPIGTLVKPDTVFNVYMACNVVGVGIGFYLANRSGFNSFVSLFIIATATMYLYSDSFQRIPVIKNITVAFLVVLSIALVPAFDLAPLIGRVNRSVLETYVSIILDYALFGFLLHWIREIIKDIQDINGDHRAELRTLPVLLGMGRSRNLAIALTGIAIALLVWYCYTYLGHLLYTNLYLACTIAFPLCVLIHLLSKAKKPQHYQVPSLLIKGILLFGIFSLALIQWEINYVLN